ncbi:MAG: hypothetical protein JSV10_01090, partial [Candidatus Zixiibacteriota bacterium]
WCWNQGDERRLIVTNYSDIPSQGYVHLSDDWLPESEKFLCLDVFKDESYVRNTSEVQTSGMYVGLDERGFHFFRIERG